MEKDAQKINAVIKQNHAKMTNRELVDELARQGVTVSVSEVQAALRRLGFSSEIESRGALPGRRRQVETLSLHAERSKESTVYAKAVKDYESALSALRKKRYAEAAEAFAAVEKTYTQEREIADRARSYRLAAERRATEAPELSTRGFQDAYLSGLLYVNARQFDKAEAALKKALSSASGAPQKARVHYALATLAAKQNRQDEALENLRQALEGDPQFRLQLADDVDFRGLHESPEFRNLLSSPMKKSA